MCQGFSKFSRSFALFRIGQISHQQHELSTLRWSPEQSLSQDLETGCLKLAIVNLLGVQIFKGDNNILQFQT